MFKPNNLRKAFFGLLALGAMRAIDALTMFFAFGDSSMFSISVPQLLKNVLLSFSPAALTYILYWFAKRKYGEEPEEEKKPEPEDENLIPEEKLKKIIYIIVFGVAILMLLWSIFFRN